MRYLREHSDLHIAETDEEVMKANGGIWPDDKLKNEVLVPQTTTEILNRKNVIYFASYVPDYLLRTAKEKGFSILVLETPLNILEGRNSARMKTESYNDVSEWFDTQLDSYKRLAKDGVIDQTISGSQSLEELAEIIVELTK